MNLIVAPNKISRIKRPAIFLAGSIEMGKAEKWQNSVIRELENYDITIFNPRRSGSKWGSGVSMKDKKFVEQVSWELNALEKSDYIIMYFDPKSKSPISLLELGLFARSHKIYCCCSKEFWRDGNVEFVCKKFKIPLYENLEDLMKGFKLKIKSFIKNR